MSKTILIADGGSTKTHWALCGNETPARRFATPGFNPALAGSAAVVSSLTEVKEAVGGKTVDEVQYFGAGCATPAICEELSEELRKAFPCAEVTVGTDLLAAAKSLLPDRDGIVCIMGTGSNSGLWQDGRLTANVPPLGFILGDEGSGARLGARALADALRGILPEDTSRQFLSRYGIDKGSAIEHVYRKPNANIWLASLVPFLAEHAEVAEVRTILIEEFSTFLLRNVELYPDSRSYPLAFAGSVAYHFREVLETVARSMGYVITETIQNPIEKLIQSYEN